MVGLMAEWVLVDEAFTGGRIGHGGCDVTGPRNKYFGFGRIVGVQYYPPARGRALRDFANHQGVPPENAR